MKKLENDLKNTVFNKEEVVGRGCLSKSKQEIINAFRGKEVSIRELRLYPYIYDCSVNGNRVSNINEEERAIRQGLIDDGFIENQIGCPKLSDKGKKLIQFALKWAYPRIMLN